MILKIQPLPVKAVKQEVNKQQATTDVATQGLVPLLLKSIILKEMQYISDAPLNGIDDGSGDFDDYIQYSKFIATIENLLASDTL